MRHLAAVAEDLAIAPQTLVGTLLADGLITQDEADRYPAALEEAFSSRGDRDGEEATPTSTGLAA
ncbi:hypothetical protein [Geodermatophilus sp. SYSU D01036]